MAILNRVSAGIMRQFVSWDTACNFNDVIQKSQVSHNWYIYSSNQAVLYKCQGQTLIVCKHFLCFYIRRKRW